jgi:peptide methionine sulfoxide reductase MsrA
VELYNPKKHFEELCCFFFTFHDPTLKNRQGNDQGFQYLSWILCVDDEQFEIAKKSNMSCREQLMLELSRHSTRKKWKRKYAP